MPKNVNITLLFTHLDCVNNIYTFTLESLVALQQSVLIVLNVFTVNSPGYHGVEKDPQTPDVTSGIITLFLQNLHTQKHKQYEF